MNKASPDLSVVVYSQQRMQAATTIADAMAVPVTSYQTADKKRRLTELELRFHPDRVELYDSSLNATVSIDFIAGAMAHRKKFGGGRGQAIARAMGLKSGRTPSVLDVTAGLAGDSYVLATLGCPVTMIERSPVNAALIRDALERASLNEDFQTILQQGFELIEQDANQYMCEQMQSSAQAHDVVYIDPMYPHRKKSALVKKDMQMLHKLLAQDPDNQANNQQLLENAMRYARKRVVVKRPTGAPALDNRKVSTSVSSKNTRYDIYALEKI